MNLYHFAYTALPLALAPLAMPGLWWYVKRDPQKRRVLAERLGFHPRAHGFHGSPKIWLHAVSVGEVKAAESVMEALHAIYPAAAFLLTTTTATGQEEALRRLDGLATVCYAPVDLWTAVGRFLSAFRPDVLACMETEIWPNWIEKARRAGMTIVFLNGRLSSRSIRAYLKIRPLLKPVLERVDAFSMISDADARRIIALGAPSQRVVVNGNVKNDVRIADQQGGAHSRFNRLFAVGDRTPVFIGGSVRGDEAAMMLDVFERLAGRVPGLLCIIAPRHLETASMIERLARERGIACQRRSELGKAGQERTAQLIILDTIGELRDVYGIATVVFGGASLVPLGGQNVLEAAAWGKPVLFGPHMDDFSDARALLEASGGGICIQDAEALAERAAHMLTHPEKARRLGALARQAVMSGQGAAMRHARVVARLLPCRRP